MCCCPKPDINGEPGFLWNNPQGAPGVYPVNPPDIPENETLLYDEPGRCGGVDSHSHHYRVTKYMGSVKLYVRHGAGDDHLGISLWNQQVEILELLDSNSRYWVLNAIHHAYRDGERKGENESHQMRQRAAAEKRIKTRKVRGGVKVWINPLQVPGLDSKSTR
jgi:hypothetical protein